MSYTVQIFNAIAKSAMEKLNVYNFKEVKEKGDIIIVRSADLHKDEKILTSTIVARAGVGVNNIPEAKLTEKLIPLVYAPGGNADSVAESTIGLMLVGAKQIAKSTTFVKSFEGKSEALEDVKKNYKGLQLKGSVLMLFGLGNIGCRVAHAASSLGMKVIFYIRKATKEYVEEKLTLDYGEAVEELLKCFRKGCIPVTGSLTDISNMKDGDIVFTSDIGAVKFADFFSSHIGPANKGFFNGNFFKTCKKGAIFVNTDRGTLVVEKDLLEALNHGQIGGYLTDFAPEDLTLRKHDKVVSSPHTAASTEAAEDNCAEMVVKAICEYIFDGNVVNSKNFPAVQFDRDGPIRITFCSNKKIECGSVTAELKKYKINQFKCVNNGKIFYSIFDINDEIPESEFPALKSKLESALGVKVRILTRCSKFEEIKSKVVGKRIPVNFSAGPAILPRSVIDQLSAGMVDFAGDGLSIGEISHRSKQVQALVKETEVLVRELLKVPDNYVIFFIQGGATLQFGLIPMNFATKDDLVGYVEMGQWSKLCIEDAYLCEKMGYGKVQLLGTGKPDSYRSIPKFDIPQNLKYIYLCHNETVHGLEFEEIPDSGKVPYILDVSSDIFAKPIDFVNRNIGMVFAGAQKNTGFAGCAIVVIRKDFLNEKVVLPSYFNYAVQASTGSFVNTPPVVTIFSINLMMKWVKEKGGVDKLFELNKEKANLLYDYIDSTNGYYVNRVPIKSQRSIMNVVFNMGNRSMEDTLQKAAIKAGIYGLDGHRSIGGCRASIYNAMDIVGVKKLIEFLKKFRKENP